MAKVTNSESLHHQRQGRLGGNPPYIHTSSLGPSSRFASRAGFPPLLRIRAPNTVVGPLSWPMLGCVGMIPAYTPPGRLMSTSAVGIVPQQRTLTGYRGGDLSFQNFQSYLSPHRALVHAPTVQTAISVGIDPGDAAPSRVEQRSTARAAASHPSIVTGQVSPVWKRAGRSTGIWLVSLVKMPRQA
jgi:hypothetical protein